MHGMQFLDIVFSLFPFDAIIWVTFGDAGLRVKIKKFKYFSIEVESRLDLEGMDDFLTGKIIQ